MIKFLNNKKKGIKMMGLVFCITLCIILLMKIILYNTCWKIGRRAIQQEDFDKYKNYIIVKGLHYTSTGWAIIGDNTGYFESKDDIQIILKGEVPPYISDGKQTNSFLCNVIKEEKTENPTTGELVDVFNVVDWKPIYPVVHDKFLIFSSWPGSKNYLTEREMRGR